MSEIEKILNKYRNGVGAIHSANVELINQELSELLRGQLVSFYQMLEKNGHFPNSAGYANFYVDRFYKKEGA